jgi:hypothetical protein
MGMAYQPRYLAWILQRAQALEGISLWLEAGATAGKQTDGDLRELLWRLSSCLDDDRRVLSSMRCGTCPRGAGTRSSNKRRLQERGLPDVFDPVGAGIRKGNREWLRSALSRLPTAEPLHAYVCRRLFLPALQTKSRSLSCGSVMPARLEEFMPAARHRVRSSSGAWAGVIHRRAIGCDG